MSKYRNKLADRHRVYVIKRLAAYHTLSSIVQGLKKKFGITMSLLGVYRYNPVQGPRVVLAQRWKELFWKEREAYLARTAKLGVTDKPARIRQREAMMHREWAAGRHARANEILDSIAKDIDDGFGKKRRR
jgi:hypothetical protein